MSSWKKCNMCKNEIEFQKKFWVCNVSTCNQRRTGMKFCSVDCYDAHLPNMNHRESWAIEVRAPNETEWKAYAADQGEDAVWPPKEKIKKTEEASLPSGGFGGTANAGAPVVIKRRKSS